MLKSVDLTLSNLNRLIIISVSLGAAFTYASTDDKIPSSIITKVEQQPNSKQPSKFRWHSFGNQGYIKTSNYNFFGDSQDGSWAFNDLGLGASWKPNARLQISAQAITRRAGKTSQDGVQLDYGFIDLNLINNFDYALGFRAGRVKNPYGFYNETRDIASSRPSILLPQSIYLDSLRRLFHTMDGLSSYGHMQWGDTLFNLDVNYGKPLIDDVTQDAILVTPLPGQLNNEKIFLARAILEQDAGRWRMGYSYSQLNSDYSQPTTITPFTLGAFAGKANIYLHLLSFEYNWAQWQLTTEYQRRKLEHKDIYYPEFYNAVDNESWYGQVSYQFSPELKIFARYDVYYLFRDDKEGKEFSERNNLTAHAAYAKDSTIGLRYSINSHWMLAAEYHYINGTAWLAEIENHPPLANEPYWDLFTAQISFKF